MSRAAIRVAGVVATLAVAFLGFRTGHAWQSSVYRQESVANQPNVDALPRAGRQVVVVYVGSSRCNASNQTDVLLAVSSAFESVRKQATQQKAGFVSIGIARELSARAGLLHLSSVYRFDELSSGQGQLNQAAYRFVSKDHPGIAATPQIIVVERQLAPMGSTVDDVEISERILLRKVGAVEISQWAGRGAPVPRSSTNHVQQGSI